MPLRNHTNSFNVLVERDICQIFMVNVLYNYLVILVQMEHRGRGDSGCHLTSSLFCWEVYHIYIGTPNDYISSHL